MADLGDITGILKEGSGVTNLDWLDVDEREYRRLDTLPKQNLQVSPDLEAIWSHEDKPATSYLEPNKADLPRTMGDMSQAHGPLRAKPSDIVRSVRLAMMQTTDPARIQDALVRRYDGDSIREASQQILEALQERGLLGKLYVAASDFPFCSSGKGLELALKQSSGAPFVVAKMSCSDCVHAKKGPTGSLNCAQFHKQVVVNVPYSEALAEKIESLMQSKGRDIQASAADPRTRIQEALLAPAIKLAAPAAMPKPVENVIRLLGATKTPEPVALPVNLTVSREEAKKVVEAAFQTQRISVQAAQHAFRQIASASSEDGLMQIRAAVGDVQVEVKPVYRGAGEQPLPTVSTPEAAADGLDRVAKDVESAQVAATKLAAERRAAPIIALLRREMLKGRGPKELVTALRLAFDVRDLADTKALWEPTFRENGLFGVVYASQESFGDCREGADFLARHNPGVRVMVAGTKCCGCIYSKIGRCLLYGKPLVASVSAAVTPEMVAVVQQEHVSAGRLASTFMTSGTSPAQALRNIHNAVEAHRTTSFQAASRANVQTAFHGNAIQATTSGITRREIVRTASRYINEGLYGKQLLEAMQARFAPRDLVAAKADLKPVLAEQGLQGIYYIDPSIYADYGHGCEEAMRLHRSRLVPEVKLGSKCISCILQTKAGYCSKLNKNLVKEPTYLNREAQQREILSSGLSTEVSYADLINNGHSMMQEFEMGQREARIDIDAPTHAPDVTIEFGNQGIKL